MSDLANRDLASIWHPYTQMKTAAKPIPIVKGEGVYLFTEDGKKLIDAVSSWWVNIHGHSHPYIAEKVFERRGLEFNDIEKDILTTIFEQTKEYRKNYE